MKAQGLEDVTAVEEDGKRRLDFAVGHALVWMALRQDWGSRHLQEKN